MLKKKIKMVRKYRNYKGLDQFNIIKLVKFLRESLGKAEAYIK
jgi:hypothetical protein